MSALSPIIPQLVGLAGGVAAASMVGGSEIPKPPKPPEPPDRGEADEAAAEERRREDRRRGAASTMLTGPGGLTGEAPTRQQTLLGS